MLEPHAGGVHDLLHDGVEAIGVRGFLGGCSIVTQILGRLLRECGGQDGHSACDDGERGEAVGSLCSQPQRYQGVREHIRPLGTGVLGHVFANCGPERSDATLRLPVDTLVAGGPPAAHNAHGT